MFPFLRKYVFLFLIFLLALSGLGGCSSDSQGDRMSLMPLDQMPAEVQMSPVVVQQAYQFSSANPGILQEIPCYCGCGGIGHTSNYSCYVAGQDENGRLVFDNHALGCSICVDITQDTMRLLKQGKTVPEIKAYIDETYSKYGPSNMP